MTDKKHVFISYATKDAGFVNVLRKDLAAQNIPYWIDKEGLRPGTINWEKGIRQALRDAFAVIYVVTPASYASDNVQGEIAIAEVEGCTIYPIWADGDKWHDCVPIDKVKTQYIDMQGDKYELNRQVLFNALGGKRPDLVMPAPTVVMLPTGVTPRNPYKGLNAFTEKDVADFFGRDKLISELLQAVNARIQDRKDLFLTLIGASGSGKSSVVMAGLLPRLKAGAIPGSDQWTYLKPMVPGNHPVQALAKVLYSAPGRSLSNNVIDEDLSHPNGIGLFTTAETLSRHPVVLYIDQFEELFMTGVVEEERQQFINLLINAVTQIDSPVLVLLTMRADFYDRPMNYPELGRLVQSYNRSVLPMSIADLRDTVEKPAAAAGLSFEAGLISDIIFDLRDDKNALAGALPLLQYTLEQLYEHRTGYSLTTATYQGIGGVKGAIGAHAEEIFQTLDAEAQNAFSSVFQALVHVDERGTPTRKREAESVLTTQAPSARLVEALIKRARVLRVYTDKLGDIPYIEVAHEALLASWKRLSDWIKNADNDLRLIQEMKAATARWISEGRPKHRLWSHELLQPVYVALDRLPQQLTSNEQTFIQPEAERLLQEFKYASEHVQLTILERDFKRIGQTSVKMLVFAYGYGQTAHIREQIADFLWDFPIDVANVIRFAVYAQDPKIRSGVIRLISCFEMSSFVHYLLITLNDSDEGIRRTTKESLMRLANMNVALDSQTLESYTDQAIVAALMNVGTKDVIPDLLEMLNGTDRLIRREVLKALGELGSASAIPILLNVFNDKDSDYQVRQEVLKALGQLGNASVIPELLIALKDRVWQVRASAVNALSRVGDINVVPALLETLQHGETELIMAVAETLINLVDANSASELLSELRNNNPTVRQAIVEVLGQIGDTRIVPALLNTLDDSNVMVRKAAVKALGQVGDVKIVPMLIDAFHDSHWEVREEAVRALGQVGDTKIVPTLIGALKDIDIVRQSAVEALRQIGKFGVPPALVETACYSEWQVREAAIVVLGYVGDSSIVPVLLDILNDSNGIVRRAAVEALGRVGDASITPSLLRMLEDDMWYVQWSALSSLKQVGDQSILPILLDALVDSNGRVRAEVVEMLGDLGEDRVNPILLDVITNREWNVREAAAKALSKVGDKSSIPILLDSLKDSDKNVRRAVVDALGHLGDMSIVPTLLDCLKDSDRNIRQAAAKALGQVGDSSLVPRLLSELKLENSDIQTVMIEVMKQTADSSVVPLLIEALKDRLEPVRQGAAEILGVIKSSDAVSPLVELLDHPFGLVAKPARQALELMDIPESRAALAEYDAKHKG